MKHIAKYLGIVIAVLTMSSCYYGGYHHEGFYQPYHSGWEEYHCRGHFHNCR